MDWIYTVRAPDDIDEHETPTPATPEEENRVIQGVISALANRALKDGITKELHWFAQQGMSRRRSLRLYLYKEGVENRTIKEIKRELMER